MGKKSRKVVMLKKDDVIRFLSKHSAAFLQPHTGWIAFRSLRGNYGLYSPDGGYETMSPQGYDPAATPPGFLRSASRHKWSLLHRPQKYEGRRPRLHIPLEHATGFFSRIMISDDPQTQPFRGSGNVNRALCSRLCGVYMDHGFEDDPIRVLGYLDDRYFVHAELTRTGTLIREPSHFLDAPERIRQLVHQRTSELPIYAWSVSTPSTIDFLSLLKLE